MFVNDPILLAKKLITFQSVTPEDGGSLEYVRSQLKDSKFYCNLFVENNVKILFARWKPEKPYEKTIAFNGHVDVVHPGDPKQWKYGAFSGEIKSGRIFGRGAVDMKSAVAAFMCAASEAILEYDL